MKICFFRQSWTKGCGQIHEIKHNRFSMKCFAADILRVFTEMCGNLAFGCLVEELPSNPSISGIFLKFSYFLRSLVVTHSETCETTRTFTFW